MERAFQATPDTIEHTWYGEDGAIVNPGTVTITIDRANGTNVVPATTPTSGTGAAKRTFDLTADHTALLDTLKVTWSSTLKGTAVDYVEVAGRPYFTIAEARALEELADVNEYPPEAIASHRTLAESAIEEECGRAFVPRYARERLSGRGSARLLLSGRHLRQIRDVTIGGTALTSPQVEEVVADGRELYRPYGWDVGTRNVVVGYEHGLDYPPPRLARAALILAKNWLVKGPIDDRAVSIPAGDAGGVISLATPGVRGAVFGIPEVDLVVQRYRVRELVG